MPFDEYLKLPSYSNSFMKSEINGIAPGVDVTDNMRLGSIVDNLLTSPKEVDVRSDLYEPGRSIALEIKRHFGLFIDRFEKQVSYTGDMCFNGFKMPIKGRLDFLIKDLATIDLKVTTAKDIPALINFMGYDNQMFNYSGLAQTPKIFLIVYVRPLKTTKIVQIPLTKTNNFWEEKIIKFGFPI